MKTVRIQLTGSDADSVELVRQLIVGQLNQKQERVSSDDKTRVTKGRKDGKYEGNGIAYMVAVWSRVSFLE